MTERRIKLPKRVYKLHLRIFPWMVEISVEWYSIRFGSRFGEFVDK